MKQGLAVVAALLGFAVFGSNGRAEDAWKQNQSQRSQFPNLFRREGGAKQFQNLPDVIPWWKKKKHHNQPPQNPPKPPVTPFPPIVTDPIPNPRPIVNDHRNPNRPSWGKPIDASGASGGTVVTNTPIIRDHRKPKVGGANPGGVFGNGTAQPVVRDHREGAGQGGVTVSEILGGGSKTPVIRDHRDAPVVRDHRK